MSPGAYQPIEQMSVVEKTIPVLFFLGAIGGIYLAWLGCWLAGYR